MKKTFLIFSIIFVVFFSSCKQNENAIDPQNPLIGTWVYTDYEQINSTEYVTVYSRKPSFDNNNSGISFKANNQLIERKNIGFCGTPPISYGEYNGSYSLKDKQITTESDSWNGKTTERYEIVSIDDKLLKIKQLR
jgi:hypothetical protein